MTYTTTHLGIAVILIYFLLPQRLKEYLRDNPKVFFFTSLGAVLPDLDLLTNGHRAYGHSILFPLILLVLAPTIEKLSKKDNISKNLRLFAAFWVSHMIYDTTFGPLALFFPIDPRFYDIKIGLTFNIATQIVTPSGFFLSIQLIDQRTGVSSFFINLTPQERIDLLGTETVNWAISDFFLHATLFLWYCGFVLIPAYRAMREGIEKTAKSDISLDYTWKYQKWLTPLFLLFLTLGFIIAGPYHGSTWIDRAEDTSTVDVSNDNIQFIGSKIVRVPDNAEFNATITTETDLVNYSLFLVEVNTTTSERAQAFLQNNIEKYRKGNLNYTSLVLNYQNYLAENISADPVPISRNTSGKWYIESSKGISLLFGLWTWQVETSFQNIFKFKYEWKVSLQRSYITGMILTGISGVLLFTSIYQAYLKNKAHEE